MATSRQLWRRKTDEQIRQNRVAMEFIKLKYPQIYLESVNLYKDLTKKYPNKQDVRKLPEFYQLCQGPSTVKTETETIKPNQFSNNPNKVNQFRDNMVLNINLMSNPSTSEPMETTPQDTSVPSTSEDLHHLELLDQGLVDQIIEELKRDGDIKSFFDDIDTDMVIEDMEIDNMTPLEQELEHLLK